MDVTDVTENAMDVTAAIHQQLAADLPLAALLSRYREGPAIFNGVVPPDAEPPWILIEGIRRDEAADTRGLRLRRLQVRLRCIAAAGAGGGRLQALAARAQALLHGTAPAKGSGAFLAQSCSGPLVEPGGPGYLQQRLELSLLFNDFEEEP